MTRISQIIVHTLLLLALVEGAARIAEWVHPSAETLAFDYAPYRMLRMSRAPWPLNREGFRARELETYRNTFLIEFLGGSVCLGVGTNPGKTLPERLEEKLHQMGLARAAVLNLCQGGAPSAQELAIFLEYGLPLQPQVVLSFSGANDLMHPGPIGEDDAANLPYRNREMQAGFEGHHSSLAHLAVARVAARLMRRSAGMPANVEVPTDSILRSYLYTEQVARVLTQAQGGWYALLFQPTLHYQKPWSAQEQAMWHERRPRDREMTSRRTADLYRHAVTALANWSATTKVTVFDLSAVFAATPETIYSDSVHFTGDAGYRMLAAELERQGWIGEIAARYRQWDARARPELAGVSSWLP